MTPDAAKALSRRALGMWAGGAPDVSEAIFTLGYRNHQEPAAGGGVKMIGLADWVALAEANHRAFPDLQVEFLMQVAEADRVATHWRFTATQAGAHEGLAATGKRVSWSGVQIDRIEGDRIAESWVVWDKFTQFETLGLLK